MGAISEAGLKEIALLYGEGTPLRDVPLKEKAGRDNSTKRKPSKEKPEKCKPDAAPVLLILGQRVSQCMSLE